MSEKLVAAPNSNNGTESYETIRISPMSAPPRPRRVSGYTPHALQRMQERGISKEEVEALVASFQPRVYNDDNDTWLLYEPSTTLTVIINKNGYIVTGLIPD